MDDFLVRVVLGNPAIKLPMPGAARLFSAEGETVDVRDAFWLACLADGSVVRETPAPAPASPFHSED